MHASRFAAAMLAALHFPVLAQEPAAGIPPEKLSFEKDIKPILREKCLHCHNRKTLPDKPGFENAKRAFVKTPGGLSVVVPGDPEKSLMITAISLNSMHEGSMPMVGERPTAEDISLLKRWIKEGANWPKGRKGKIKPPFYARE